MRPTRDNIIEETNDFEKMRRELGMLENRTLEEFSRRPIIPQRDFSKDKIQKNEIADDALTASDPTKVDISQGTAHRLLVTDANGKVVTSNTTTVAPSAGTGTTIATTNNADFVVSTQRVPSGGTGASAFTNAWKRIWKSGFVELGWQSKTGAGAANNTITFPLSGMPSADYIVARFFSGTASQSTAANLNVSQAWGRTATYFSVFTINTGEPTSYYLAGY